MNEKTTPIYVIMGIISIANSDDSDNFPSLFSRLLDRHYQIGSTVCLYLQYVYIYSTSIFIVRVYLQYMYIEIS